jgi:hypothetical protein
VAVAGSGRLKAPQDCGKARCHSSAEPGQKTRNEHVIFIEAHQWPLHSLFLRRLAVLAGTRLSIAHLSDWDITDWEQKRLSVWAIDSEQMMQMVTGFGLARLLTVVRQDGK